MNSEQNSFDGNSTFFLPFFFLSQAHEEGKFVQITVNALSRVLQKEIFK